MYTKIACLILFFCCCAVVGRAQQLSLSELLAEAKQQQNLSAGERLVAWLQVYDEAQEEDPSYLPEVCQSIAEIYQSESLHREALPYYLQALNLSDPDLPEGKLTKLYNRLGYTYGQLLNRDSSLLFYNKILTFHQKQNNASAQINTLQEMINLFSEKEDFQKTLELNVALNKLLTSGMGSTEDMLRSYNNLGYNYNQLQQYEEAILYFEKALELSPKKDQESRMVLNRNIGVAYFNLEEDDKSLRHLKRAREYQEKLNSYQTEQLDHLLTTIYLRKKDIGNAMLSSQDATKAAKINNNQLLLKDIYYTSALLSAELSEYDVALVYFQKHLQLKDSFELETRFKQQQMLQMQIDLERTKEQLKLLMINEEVQDLTINQLEVEKRNQSLVLRAKEAELLTQQTEKELLLRDNGLKLVQIKTQELESQRTKQALELARQRLIASQKDTELKDLEKQKQMQTVQLAANAAQLENEQRAKELLERDKEILTRDKSLNELALGQQKQRTQFLFGLGALMTLLMLIAGAAWINSRRLNRQLNKNNRAIELQKEEISAERNKSDQLLLNILPEQTAHELKETGQSVPKLHENATVLFTDFVGFTSVASGMSPEQLIEELNTCFQQFDIILEKHGLEKIKTIGDAYMCVAGVPTPDVNHSLNAIRAGKEIIEFMDNRILEKRAQGIPYWQMRMGMHSGPVVAGVVGKKKFAYDIWGDTVNTASRMESNGEPGKINISETTYELVKTQVNCNYRGKILAKNIGELNMYFVA